MLQGFDELPETPPASLLDVPAFYYRNADKIHPVLIT